MRAAPILIILLANFLVPGMALGEDSYGRLFTTSAERANLDYLRKTTKQTVILPDQPTAADAAPVAPSPVSVEGYVKRGDGKKGTVWINNAPVQEGLSTSDVQVGKLQRDGNQVPLKLSGSGKNLNLKAGQVYVPETDTIEEVGAHAKKMTKDEAEDSGIIGSSPANSNSTESPDSKEPSSTKR